MDELLTSIAAKKQRLDELRPLSPQALANLEHYYDIELTYTSNAIEGNTLSPVETTLVIEKGITIGGKPLKDHLEALDHYDAIRVWSRDRGPLRVERIGQDCLLNFLSSNFVDTIEVYTAVSRTSSSFRNIECRARLVW
jgi:Fic family protein